ncbi:MAG: hypothetical protein NDI61_04410 [Bdellovibrionaceae bacterium]|nr:hypothetical protein [Pseudobdellovibrionaceae bacterium]
MKRKQPRCFCFRRPRVKSRVQFVIALRVALVIMRLVQVALAVWFLIRA